MSPDNKKKLLILRKKLDKIDDRLLNIIKKRSNYVKKVLSLKEFKSEIIDRKRIKLILKNIKKKSIKKGIDTKISYRIWKNMIYTSTVGGRNLPRERILNPIIHTMVRSGQRSREDMKKMWILWIIIALASHRRYVRKLAGTQTHTQTHTSVFNAPVYVQCST